MAEQQIRALCATRLTSTTPDLVAAVEELFGLVDAEARVSSGDDGGGVLRFELSGQEPVMCDVPHARSTLRYMCARVAVLCTENGAAFAPYGGEGTVRLEGRSWHVEYKNAPGDVWLVVRARG